MVIADAPQEKELVITIGAETVDVRMAEIATETEIVTEKEIVTETEIVIGIMVADVEMMPV